MVRFGAAQLKFGDTHNNPPPSRENGQRYAIAPPSFKAIATIMPATANFLDVRRLYLW